MATRVCILTSGHTVTDTRIFHREAKTLARSGYQVVLHGAQPNPGDPIPASRCQLLVHSFKPTRSRLNRFLISFPRALFFALRVRAQIYHLHDPELLPLALVLKFFGRRVVCDIHEDYYRQLQDKSFLPRPLRPLLASLFHRWEKFVARHIDGVITATETVANRLGPAPRRVVTVKNYPDLTPHLAVSVPFDRPERCKTPPSSRAGKNPFRLIHLARTLTPERGITLLLDALCKLPDCELILGGKFVSTAYEREIKSHPGYKSVRYLGIIPHPDCFQWYAVSDAGVVPSLPVLGYEFALPVKMFEFMKAELPVVVPDFPPLRAIIQQYACGLTFVPGNVDSLVAAIQNLKSQREKASTMGKNGRQAVTKIYNWANEEKKLLQLYERIV
ncbi:MAG: glycosyltransferase family 4 protein [bacterium]